MHNWMANARALAPSLHAPVTLIVPAVTLIEFTPLRPPMGGGSDPYEPRMRVWREECASVCMHLLVANVMTHTPLHFKAQFDGWQKILSQQTATITTSNATRKNSPDNSMSPAARVQANSRPAPEPPIDPPCAIRRPAHASHGRGPRQR